MTATLPKLSGFEEYFGMSVGSVGEDGNLMALGHHDPARTVKAMNAYARTNYGSELLVAPVNEPGWDLTRDVELLHATLITGCEPDYWGFIDDWQIETSSTPSRESFPVMYWSA